MKEGRIEKLDIKKEEFDSEKSRARVKEVREEKSELLKRGERVEFWSGINPDDLKKTDLEIFYLLEKEHFDPSLIDEKIKLTRGNIVREKDPDKRNSRQNFIDLLSHEANTRAAAEQLKAEREKENL